MSHPWWKSAVIYQIYPRSFSDADGDGVGDLEGIRRRLDYLQWLGVDAVWISPFFRSPMFDAGYDVSDYCDVDPLFGDLDAFDRLLADAHDRGLRVLIDWVPNHTSDRHPWFLDSRSSPTSRRRDWYIWRDEPNNWRAALNAGSAWTFDPASGQYYLHLFLPQQPDLNWRNEEVVDAMHGVLRFWLDRGVDGFRIDVAHCVAKDPEFADDPRCLSGQPLADFNDQPYTHELLRRWRKVVDSYGGDRVTVGEVNIRSTEAVARYYGSGDELHMAFNFPPLDAPWDPLIFRAVVEDVEEHLGTETAWPTWVLSNHDNERHRTRYGDSEQRARAAAVMLLTLRGTPFVFQGEELGLSDVELPLSEQIDPGGRDGSRAPLPWSAQPPHGWAGKPTWLPFPPDASDRSAEALQQDDGSILHLYRRLLGLRRSSPALQFGTWSLLPSSPEVLAYARAHDDDRRVVIVNFASSSRPVPMDGDWYVQLQSAGQEPEGAYSGTVPADSAVILGAG